MTRGAIRNAVEVTLRLQAGPGTVSQIAEELQAHDESVRRVIYTLRDMGHARRAGDAPAGNHGALQAVLWQFVGQPGPQPGAAARCSTALVAMQEARQFPANTCPASRHAQQIAEALMADTPLAHVLDDRLHCGESIAATVAALWQAREDVALARAAERERIAELARSRPGWFASFADCDDFAERVLGGPDV